MSVSCTKTWMIEAGRDGRLRGVELAETQRHLESCEACRREEQELGYLGARLRATRSHASEDTLKRNRAALLAALHDRSDSKPEARAPRWRVGTAILAGVALALVLIAVLERRVGSRPSPAATLTPLSGAAAAAPRYSRSTTTASEEVVLHEGSLRIARPVGEQRRLTVLVPDGKIDDIGTTFDVEVHQAHLQRVAVLEGVVVVNVEGATPVVVKAGESWTKKNRDEPVASARATDSPAPEVSAAPQPTQPTPRPSAPPRASAPERRSETNEDEAYLQIVELARTGKRDEARAAARAWLREFPRGFRRPEVAAIAE